jgi:signal transduction histidine kinase
VSSFDHILRAIRWRRYLLSWWPWRGLAYIVTTYLLLPFVGLCGFVLALPWMVVLNQIVEGQTPDPEFLFLLFASVVAVVTVGPMLAMPFAALERQRIGIVDTRRAPSGHPPITTGWFFSRYAESALWRELAYFLLFAIIGPLVHGALAALVFFDVVLIASPARAAFAQQPTAILFEQVGSVGQTIPYALAGLALVPLVVYVFGFVAGGHAKLARALLANSSATALREVTRSRARLVDAFDAERRRIERDLHDGAQHRLTSLSLQLAVARLDVADGSPAAQALDKAHEQAKELMVVLRDLIHGIRPQVLTELGLAAAVAELAGESAIPVAVTDRLTVSPGAQNGGPRMDRQRLPEVLETTAYFAVSEALANVAKHSRAKQARVELIREPGRVVVEVSDDGRGGAHPGRGSGLTGLADRVAAVNGRLLLSSPPGGPTLVRVELPWSR